jgi:hypothetical protein
MQNHSNNAPFGALGKQTSGLSKTCDSNIECYSTANKFITAYTIHVKAKGWKSLSSRSRFVKLHIPALTEEALQGSVISVYMQEQDRCAQLPFSYYQRRKAVSIKALFSREKLLIRIIGSFILNVNSRFTFKLLVSAPDLSKRYRELDWQNYEALKQAFKLVE